MIQCLRDLSRQYSIAIVTSIHQPNNDLLMLFDNLYVLAKGGICMYNGTPDRLYDHLEEAGIQCKEYQAPVEIVMKLASSRYSNTDKLLNQVLFGDKVFLRGTAFSSERTSKHCPVQYATHGLSLLAVGSTPVLVPMEVTCRPIRVLNVLRSLHL